MKNFNKNFVLIFAAALAVGLFFSARPGVSFAATCNAAAAAAADTENACNAANGFWSGGSQTCECISTTLPCNQGQVLCVGATGPEVKKLQNALNASPSNDFPKIAVDCVYGSETEADVSYFQSQNNLTPDGQAGPQTYAKLGITISGQPPTGGSCATTPPPAGTVTPPAGGASPPAASGNSCGDPGLTSVNGICVPVSKFDTGSIAGASTLVGLVLLVLKYLLILSGLIATVALVVGGFWYITAAGNEEQAEKGRKALLNAIIGMVIIIMAYAIVNILSATLTTTDITKTK